MKATLEFTLPDEKEEFDFATKGCDYHSAIWEFDQKLRSIIKYEDEKYSEEFINGVEKARELLYETLGELSLHI